MRDPADGSGASVSGQQRTMQGLAYWDKQEDDVEDDWCGCMSEDAVMQLQLLQY